MNNSIVDNTQLREKIRAGLNLAFKRLIAYKKKNDGVFVFSENGKIVKVNARDIKE